MLLSFLPLIPPSLPSLCTSKSFHQYMLNIQPQYIIRNVILVKSIINTAFTCACM
jgi:hypothetical protein